MIDHLREYRAIVSGLIHLHEVRHGGQAVDQHNHALQVATRLQRAGADDQLVVAGLVHDLAKVWHEENHGPVVAAMMAGRLRPELLTMLASHADLRGGRQEPATSEEALFLECDAASVDDPLYPSLSLGAFLSRIRVVCGA